MLLSLFNKTTIYKYNDALKFNQNNSNTILQALKLLHNSTEYLPLVLYLAAPVPKEDSIQEMCFGKSYRVP